MATDTGREFDGSGLQAGLGLDDPRRLIRGFAGLVGFVALWYLVSLTQPAIVLPSPFAVAAEFRGQFPRGR